MKGIAVSDVWVMIIGCEAAVFAVPGLPMRSRKRGCAVAARVMMSSVNVSFIRGLDG